MLPTLPPHDPRPDQPVRPEFLSVRASRYLLGMVFAVGMFWVGGPVKDVLGPVPVGPPLPAQTSTTDARDMVWAITRAALPPPVDNQLRAPCDPDVEEEINGYCWTPLGKTKCPPLKAFEHNGKCYRRVLRVERIPQSGEVRAGNVAGEP
jgi:hypothetical protein